VYSVCTVSQAEGGQVVDRFLSANPEWVADDLGAEYPQYTDPAAPGCLQLRPDRDGTDGFFIARLRRAGRGRGGTGRRRDDTTTGDICRGVGPAVSLGYGAERD
jgi:hypothetical protein